MNSCLLDVLRCPRCGGSFVLSASVSYAATSTDEGARIRQGQLQCVGCAHCYPIAEGVPRLDVEDGVVPETRRGFEYQWRRRHSGRSERPGTVYGYDIAKFMRWLTSMFVSDPALLSPESWLLDAGCGSGEQARELARRFPDRHVIAMDLSASVALAARTSSDVPNLHFVQANILRPPLRPQSCAFVLCMGVLHHTPDTQRAFAAVASLVAPAGGLLTWIYPSPSEGPFWAGLYRQRDRHFLGLGHRLPAAMTMGLCHIYVAVFFPLVMRFIKQQHAINRERFPFYPDRPTVSDVYKSSVFLSFDNVMPTHQFRHGRAEVDEWYRAHGFGPVHDRYPGFFYATREPLLEGVRERF